MKNSVTIIFILLCTTITFSQEEEQIEVLKADSTWTKEILKMPLGFAQGIEYEGYEDIRFAQGWAKKDSSDFWTYTFAWHIKGIQKQTTENLERHMKLYFDGLMLPPIDNKKKVSQATVLFIKNPNEKSSFIGKIRTYDRFHTNEMITLNCTVKSYYCETKNKSTIVFRFSPKAFETQAWNGFKNVKLSGNLCKD